MTEVAAALIREGDKLMIRLRPAHKSVAVCVVKNLAAQELRRLSPE